MHELLINEGRLVKDSQQTHIYQKAVQHHVHRQKVQSSTSRQSTKEADTLQQFEHFCPPCVYLNIESCVHTTS